MVFKTKLSIEQAEDIRRLYRSVLPNGRRAGIGQLAKEFHASPGTISKVIDGKHPYQHPPVTIKVFGDPLIYLSAGG